MKNLLFCMVLVYAGFGVCAQIGARAQQGKIFGIWTNNEFGFQMVLMLHENGTGEFDGEVVTFKTDGDKLILTQQQAVNTYNFNLAGNSLTLSGGDIEKPITFVRQGSEPAQSAAAPQKADKATTVPSGVPSGLLGKWTGYNESIEFKSDGKCMFQGQSIPYSVSGNDITLQGQNGNILMAYVINGNQVTFTVNGQQFSYNKEGSAPANNMAPGNTGARNLDTSIVGKWCYVNVYSSGSGGSSSSECITLKQDGTYEYYSESSRSVNTADVAGGTASQNSDQGSWWVQGDRVFYQSQTQGQGSYQLVKQNHPKNRDPMIVLDGKTFVTFYNKSPW